MTGFVPPSAEEQLKFMRWMQRLFTEGEFTATYKYALIMALAELSIEYGDDSGQALELSRYLIAEKFAEFYWPQSAPYQAVGLPPAENPILSQNKGQQAAIVKRLLELRNQGYISINKARASKYWTGVVRKIAKIVFEMPVERLQNLGGKTETMLYDLPGKQESLLLKPGVVFNLRRFQGFIMQLARAGWIEHVRSNKNNLMVIGQDSDLETFMFHSSRINLSRVSIFLSDLQSGSCFYCRKSLKDKRDVDHFIPWARYPRDLAHNFVLAHDHCNRAKSDWLASQEHLERWLEWVELNDKDIQNEVGNIGIVSDLEGSLSIARWAYSQGLDNQAKSWIKSKNFEPLSPTILDCFQIRNRT